jgi:hypothetical protein
MADQTIAKPPYLLVKPQNEKSESIPALNGILTIAAGLIQDKKARILNEHVAGIGDGSTSAPLVGLLLLLDDNAYIDFRYSFAEYI